MDVEIREKGGLTTTTGEICGSFLGARVVIITKYDADAIRRAVENEGTYGFVVKENLL